MVDDRGLSDVIAFVLTFSIIILSVSAVSVVGVEQLSEVRDREQVNGAERSMVSIAETFDDISRNGDRFRTADIALQDGEVGINDSSVTVLIGESTTDGEENLSLPGTVDTAATVDVNALEHRLDKSFGETVISYESGSVFRHNRDGDHDPTMGYRPTMRCAEDQRMAVLTLVRLNGSFDVGAGSPSFSVGPEDSQREDAPVEDAEQTVQLRGTLNETASEVVYENRDPSVNKTVALDLSRSANPKGWARYLDDGDTNWDSLGIDGLYRCGTADGLDSVVVRKVVIDVRTVR